MKSYLLKTFLFIFIFTGISLLNANAQDESRLMRFPTIHGSQVVFSYAGDLYSVDTTGGLARKLTNFAGYEIFAKFSPDGKQIAFTGEYDGNREVYTMPSQGGVPTRLTYTATISRDDLSDRMGPNNIVMTWKDNDHIIFRSRKITFNDFTGELYSISTKGGPEQQLPFPRGGFCSYSPDKTKLAYNRIFREFRTWKYYKGGMADDVWIYDFTSKTTENITNNVAQDVFPMWYNDKIFFLSDRDRIMNLFVYDLKTKQTSKVTNFPVYDIKFPSITDHSIIFENGGFLYTYDIPTAKLKKLTIRIADDFVNSRTVLIDATKYIENTEVSPDGKRLLFCARGDVFTVPADKGFVRNLTKSGNAHDRNAVWSPNGKYVAYISDLSGETEIYMVAQDGTSTPVQLTKNGDTYKYAIEWSPDSKKILWADKKLRLQYVDIDSKNITTVDKAEAWEFSSYTWSPDSKWIAFTKPEVITQSNIYLYNVASKNKYLITDGWFDSGAPVFSADGKYLFFTSQRDFNPIYSQTEWNHAYVDMSRIYFVTLSKDTPSPFEAKNDETKITTDASPVKPDAAKDKKPAQDSLKDKSLVVKIDLDGIQSRILSLPVKPGSYWGINIIADKVYYVKGGYKEKSSFCMYDLKEQKETELGDYRSYIFTQDRKKLLLMSGDKYYLIDVPKAKINLDKSVDISEMKVHVNKNEEWNQIYDESWRQMRDFFFDSTMHGVNWKGIHDKYKPLVNYVNHRDDLNYIIGEMIGELNIGHAYVGGGDRPKGVEKLKMGLLGAQLIKDEKSGYYQIVKILKGENWDKGMRSPLTEVGMNIKPGDYIIAVNGEPTNKMLNIYSSLIGKNDVEVELTINSKPESAGSKKVLVVPIDDESELNYYNWVQDNIRKVTEATNGKVGYVHIPDMGVAGLNEFVKYFYPQMNKKALIIDDRGNGGGNVSPMIIERLRRELSRATYSRNTVKGKVPGEMLMGPKVCLINEYSASDGDLFPYQFKRHNLGKLIGKRTWGGVTGIRGSLPFVDGSFLNKPEFSTYDEKGWIIEGHGVDPDIYIDNDPAKEFNGVDEQLNKAIEVILQELKDHPQEIPEVPAFPDKSK